MYVEKMCKGKTDMLCSITSFNCLCLRAKNSACKLFKRVPLENSNIADKNTRCSLSSVIINYSKTVDVQDVGQGKAHKHIISDLWNTGLCGNQFPLGQKIWRQRWNTSVLWTSRSVDSHGVYGQDAMFCAIHVDEILRIIFSRYSILLT